MYFLVQALEYQLQQAQKLADMYHVWMKQLGLSECWKDFSSVYFLVQALEYQLQQAQKLADMYREQVIQLEDERARIREEGEIGQELFKVC